MTWYRSDPRRLREEEQCMRHGAQARLLRDGHRLFWIEQIVSTFGQPYVLRIDYPDRFPWEPPQASIISPDVSGAPHRFTNGTLCLFNNPSVGCGPQTTALLVRNRAIAWFLAYEVWRHTGQWAAPQH